MKAAFGKSIKDKLQRKQKKKVLSSLSILTQLQESSTFHAVLSVEKTELRKRMFNQNDLFVL